MENMDETNESLREKILVLQRLLAQKNAITNQPKTDDAHECETKVDKRNKEDITAAGEHALSDFMIAAGEPITFVETREIWNDMRSTNIGAFPRFEDAFLDISRHSLRQSSRNLMLFALDETEKDDELGDSKTSSSNVDLNSPECDDDDEEGGTRSESSPAMVITEQDISRLSDREVVQLAHDLANGIKTTYSIRKRDDSSELKFIIGAMGLLWITVISIAVAGYIHKDNPKLGTLSGVTIRSILMESFILFAAELVWECFLSWIVLRYNIKINYTRKLGNLLKIPKYFVADLIPAFTSTALSMTTALAINQTLFCFMYYRKCRERVPFFAYVFLSQDRREDRPDTLIFQVTEDIMRFGIYFPFKLLVLDLIQKPSIIFIPIAVNNIGDGLAEPVGVAFGKHKYTTTALYHSKFSSFDLTAWT